MATNAAAIWRVRPGGANTNGGGYDSTISGAGTDYSQQDASQLSLTDGALTAGGTTFTSATGGFTTAMIGNALHINSGTNVVVGWYWITARASTNSITIDRDCSTGGNSSAVNFKVGGAMGGSTANPFEIARSSNNGAVAGNTVYIKGSSATINYAAPDYAHADNFLNPQTAGDATSGSIKFIVDPSQPTWRPVIKNSTQDLMIANSSAFALFEGLVFVATAASHTRIFDTGVNWIFKNCTFNLNDLTTSAFWCNSPLVLLNCEFFSKTSAAPTARTEPVVSVSYNSITIDGCYFHDCGGPCINAPRAAVIINSVFTNNVKPSILLDANGTYWNTVYIRGNTINGKTSGGDDGIKITTGESLTGIIILDNIISNHATAGKYGINVNFGTVAVNDRCKGMIDYNNFYNNTANVNGYTIGANDLTLDPQFTSATDLTLNGSNLIAKAYPRGPICGG